MNRFDCLSAPNIKLHGRYSEYNGAAAFYWTGSGIELVTDGGELWLEYETAFRIFEQWVVVEINGSIVSRQMLTASGRLCIFRGMSKGVKKEVRIYKDTQPMGDDENAYLLFRAVETDGELFETAARDMRIEFIGDSLTTGEGLIGAQGEQDWIPMFFSSINDYAVLTSKMLNADFRIMSQGGWGVLCGWNNDLRSVIPKHYENICTVVGGETFEKMGAHEKNNFASWQPDVIVVHLGTNDEGAMNQPEWKNEETGECFELMPQKDELGFAAACDKVRAAAVEFLKKLRRLNPDAHIIWTYGMCGHDLEETLSKAVEEFKNETGDSKAQFVLLPSTPPEKHGSRFHPGAEAHKEAANIISARIRELNIR